MGHGTVMGDEGKAAGLSHGWRLCCLWLFGNGREVF
jgi:hypothetical protein